jgi:hypothetical protein
MGKVDRAWYEEKLELKSTLIIESEIIELEMSLAHQAVVSAPDCFG